MAGRPRYRPSASTAHSPAIGRAIVSMEPHPGCGSISMSWTSTPAGTWFTDARTRQADPWPCSSSSPTGSSSSTASAKAVWAHPPSRSGLRNCASAGATRRGCCGFPGPRSCNCAPSGSIPARLPKTAVAGSATSGHAPAPPFPGRRWSGKGARPLGRPSLIPLLQAALRRQPSQKLLRRQVLLLLQQRPLPADVGKVPRR